VIIETPAVVVDVRRLDHNVNSWSARLAQHGVGVRPHTKTSKCAEVVSRQVAAGAVGLTVATIGEAESLADRGFDHFLHAYPVWAGTEARARRVRALHERCEYVAGVESAESAAALAEAVRGCRQPLPVAIEVDCGLHRSGIALEALDVLARRCMDLGLEVRGAFTYAGQAYYSCDAPPAAADDEVRALGEAQQVLRGLGIEPSILSAGSTPTALLSARPPVTEERPGTYVFMDRQQVALGAGTLDDVSLYVLTTVVASHADGRFVLDSGTKVLSTDRAPWIDGHGFLPAYPNAVVARLTEHHAVAQSNGPRPRVGEVLALVPNHCCVVVNLTDTLHAVPSIDGLDALGVLRSPDLEAWPVISRGYNT